MAKEFKYEIKEHVGVVAEERGYRTLELNLVSFNDAEPKFDLRRWLNKDGERTLGKGITMTGEQIRALRDLLNGLTLEDL
jgi:hypothetical protein